MCWLAVAVVLCIGCGSDDADAGFRAVVRDVQARTTPPGARLVADSPITRDTWSAEATWDVELTMSWADYVQRVSDRLASFHRDDAPPDQLTFTRTLPGDMDPPHRATRRQRTSPGTLRSAVS